MTTINKSLLSKNNFRLLIDKVPNVEFFVKTVNIPGLQFSETVAAAGIAPLARRECARRQPAGGRRGTEAPRWGSIQSRRRREAPRELRRRSASDPRGWQPAIVEPGR